MWRRSRFQVERRGMDLRPGDVHLIRGPRQVGKTVWIKRTLHGLLTGKDPVPPRAIFYLSCDALAARSRRELRHALDFFLDLSLDHPRVYLFLDEVQHVADWSHEIKSLADAGTLSRATLVLTGSAAVELGIGADLLPGRGREGNTHLCLPIDFRRFVLQSERYAEQVHVGNSELQRALLLLAKEARETRFPLGDGDALRAAVRRLAPFQNPLDWLFLRYRLTGGFPAAIDAHVRSEGDAAGVPAEIYDRYWRVAISDLTRQGVPESRVRQILAGILKRAGSRYSFHTLHGDLEEGVALASLIDAVRTLADAFVVRVLMACDPARREPRPRKDKKIYISDPFLEAAIRHALGTPDPFAAWTEIVHDDQRGAHVVEAIVGQHLAMHGERPPLRAADAFWWVHYDRRGEVDFAVAREDGGLTAIEVHWRGSVGRGDMREVPGADQRILLTRDEVDLSGDPPLVPAPIFLAALEASPAHL